MTPNSAAAIKTIDNLVNNKNSFLHINKNIKRDNEEPSIEEQRANFKFPKEFSFKDEEFRAKIDHLYGRKHFEIHYGARLKELIPQLVKSKTMQEFKENSYNILHIGQVERKEKRKVRKDYETKCMDYIIEHYHWSKGVAKATSKVIGLPNCKEHKTLVGYALLFTPASFAGNLSEKYEKPIAKLMNVEERFITISSIVQDAVSLGIVASWAYNLWTGSNESGGLIEKTVEHIYSHIGIGKDILKYALTINAGVRALEIPTRLTAYLKYKKHLPSPGSVFPINPNPFDGIIPYAYLFVRDTVSTLNEQMDKYHINLSGYKKTQPSLAEEMKAKDAKTNNINCSDLLNI
jgi:hypothetical protein